jgi:endonuclease III
MKRSDKAAKIVEILEGLYPEVPIPLDHESPFQLVVAVALSAQTTDKKVNEVTPKLFEVGGTPETMATLSQAEIKGLIAQIGLTNMKAKALFGMSRIITEQHGGVVPNTFEGLEALPGVGHKTASVVMAQAFGVPAFPVDTHIHRLAARWGLSSGKNVDVTERDLKAAFERSLWNKLHLQIIFFGRQYCPAQHHDLPDCLICGWAASKKRIKEEAQEIARRKKARKARAKKK